MTVQTVQGDRVAQHNSKCQNMSELLTHRPADCPHHHTLTLTHSGHHGKYLQFSNEKIFISLSPEDWRRKQTSIKIITVPKHFPWFILSKWESVSSISSLSQKINAKHDFVPGRQKRRLQEEEW